jgi:hypothetical protein
MSNFSQQQNSSTDLINESLITLSGTGTDTFTIELPSDLYSSSNYISTDMNTVSITGSGAGYSGVTYTTLTSNDTITLNTDYQFSWGDPQEFVDSFPDWQRVQDMCKKYPGLEIALRNFRTVYTLVKDDYDNPKDKT